MLSREDNELLTRVGPGTPMGATMRRYWIPALLSRELPEPDGPPVRVRLLGEDLVAFRDTRGPGRPARRALPASPRLAVLRAQRGVRPALRLPRLEVRRRRPLRGHDERAGGGPVQGQDPITAYPTQEIGGVIWAYMGPAERSRRRPEVRVDAASPATHRHVSKVIQECNWLQGLEGGIDTSHAPILHRLLTTTRRGPASSRRTRSCAARRRPWSWTSPTTATSTPAIRPLGEASIHVRTYHFILPFHQIRPSQTETACRWIAGHIWVPMDDETTMVYNWDYSTDGAPLTEEDARARLGNGPLDVDQKTFRSHAQPRQQLPARPPGAEDRELHRHRRHQHPGPRDPGEHGPDRGPEPRASGPRRQGDHPGAPAAPRGGADGAGRRPPRGRRAHVLHAARRRGGAAAATPTGARPALPAGSQIEQTV